MDNLIFFVVSDSVGETGELAVRAAVSQFRPTFKNVEIRRFPRVKSFEELYEVVQLAMQEKAIIIYTLVEKEMRQKLYTTALEQHVAAIDLLGPMIELLESSMQQAPLERPGLTHKLDDDYFKRIEAIEFAVKYDDGRDPRGVLLADVVLIGVSRTSKTPLSQYLAHKSLKVANVPLVPEVEPPVELFAVDSKKCFGLIISPDNLNSIRRERLKTLGLNDGAIYAQHQRIQQEIEHFHRIASRIGCEVIDVTNTAVEETANVILDKIRAQA
ncbi:kinase/pyrophosphorylase [Metasolibacillus meyeri]|uniref:Putative pyruvate, phosphate dikinase regulatory protein n=1 Tax=Metasolibacillus meyeri TaxID=1071052 RepID=A0AAW9NXK0_9BACL|nr:pyruvate, water dikinase regulatory protein [Metasolibacillus meyeri]MEC1179951.1 kinase/pyrophosphorylase [Metasolibacillus meyeri]